jgi:hypothetical protein
MAAGVVGALDRLVRARARRGRTLAVDPALAGSELALRVGADPEGAAFLDLGMRALAGSLRDAGREPPEVLAVEVGPRQLEVILAEASAPAPKPFSAKDRGRRWVLARQGDRAQLEELAEDMPAPCPTLVTVGTTPEGGRLLVDLEQAGASALVGARPAVRQVLVAATTELATSGWADFVRLVLVGMDMAGQERVRSVGSVAEVIEELEQQAAELGALVGEAGCATTLEARVRGVAADAWVPTVVVCAKAPPARLARRLAAVATTAGNAGVAVLVAGALEGAWRLDVDGEGQMTVEVLDGAVVAGQRISAEEAAAVEALFERLGPPCDDDVGGEEALDDAAPDGGEVGDTASSEEDNAPFFPNYLSGAADGRDDDAQWGPPPPATGDHDDETLEDDVHSSTGDLVRPPRMARASRARVGPPPGLPAELADLELLSGHDLLVGVMGPIEVWGAEPFPRAKALELVVYLAMHRGVFVDSERLMDALWPGWQLKEQPAGRRRPTHNTLHTTTSIARDCLDVGPSGQRRLPHRSGNGGFESYRLVDVALDIQLLCDAMARAEAIVDGDRPGAKVMLREGLALVRGEPFAGVRLDPRGYQWALVEGAIALIEREVIKAALRLGELCLDDGDPRGAGWAARQEQLVVPGHRLLKCAEMTAAARAGDPAGVEAAMRELSEVIEADEPADALDAHTVAVYKEQLAIALGR